MKTKILLLLAAATALLAACQKPETYTPGGNDTGTEEPQTGDVRCYTRPVTDLSVTSAVAHGQVIIVAGSYPERTGCFYYAPAASLDEQPKAAAVKARGLAVPGTWDGEKAQFSALLEGLSAETKYWVAAAVSYRQDGQETEILGEPVAFETAPGPGEPVDLGLNARWASRNLGAKAPEEPGELFAWGEMESRTSFSEEDYTVLSSWSENPVNKRFGNDWRLPTDAEMRELIALCQWTREEENGWKGFRVTGPSGASIFLPFLTDKPASFNDSYYWTQNIYDYTKGRCLWFTTSQKPITNPFPKYYGGALRPVTGPVVTVSGMTISRSNFESTDRKAFPLEVNFTREPNSSSPVYWESTDEKVATVQSTGARSASVQPVGAGECTIRATAYGTEKSIFVTCKLTVK